jgi:hypothetical protein
MFAANFVGADLCYWDLIDSMGLVFETAREMNDSLARVIRES